jgi:hypothetical protein
MTSRSSTIFLSHLRADKSHLSGGGLSRLERGQVLRLLVLGVMLQADDFVARCTTELVATATELETGGFGGDGGGACGGGRTLSGQGPP